MGFVGTVVKRSEPLVPWDFQISVIHFKVSVMHLMMEGPQSQSLFVFDQQIFKAGMAGDSSQGLVLKVKQDVDWMSRQHPVDQDRGKEQQVLNRVH